MLSLRWTHFFWVCPSKSHTFAACPQTMAYYLLGKSVSQTILTYYIPRGKNPDTICLLRLFGASITYLKVLCLSDICRRNEYLATYKSPWEPHSECVRLSSDMKIRYKAFRFEKRRQFPWLLMPTEAGLKCNNQIESHLVPPIAISKAFAKLRKATQIRHVCPSVYPHRTVPLSLNWLQ
jgi:hypothetical protein